MNYLTHKKGIGLEKFVVVVVFLTLSYTVLEHCLLVILLFSKSLLNMDCLFCLAA